MLIDNFSKDDGSSGIVVSRLLSRFNIFRRVKFYKMEEKEKEKALRDKIDE